jgi:hypothetical protein
MVWATTGSNTTLLEAVKRLRSPVQEYHTALGEIAMLLKGTLPFQKCIRYMLEARRQDRPRAKELLGIIAEIVDWQTGKYASCPSLIKNMSMTLTQTSPPPRIEPSGDGHLGCSSDKPLDPFGLHLLTQREEVVSQKTSTLSRWLTEGVNESPLGRLSHSPWPRRWDGLDSSVYGKDVEMVMNKAKVSKQKAVKALMESNGNIAEAIPTLEAKSCKHSLTDVAPHLLYEFQYDSDVY